MGEAFLFCDKCVLLTDVYKGSDSTVPEMCNLVDFGVHWRRARCRLASL